MQTRWLLGAALLTAAIGTVCYFWSVGGSIVVHSSSPGSVDVTSKTPDGVILAWSAPVSNPGETPQTYAWHYHFRMTSTRYDRPNAGATFVTEVFLDGTRLNGLSEGLLTSGEYVGYDWEGTFELPPQSVSVLSVRVTFESSAAARSVSSWAFRYDAQSVLVEEPTTDHPARTLGLSLWALAALPVGASALVSLGNRRAR